MDSEMLALGICVIFGFIGCLIGHFKDRKVSGLVLGLCLGPIGLIMLLFDAGPKVATIVAVLTTIFVATQINLEIKHQKKMEELDAQSAEDLRQYKAKLDAIWSPTPTPAPTQIPEPTPQKLIPMIQSLRGYVIRDAFVQRQDVDGFVLVSKNGTAKVFNAELTPDTIQMLTAAAPKN